MRDSIYIGSSPCDEDCVQVGAEDYYNRVKKECQEFIKLIREKLGPEVGGARLVIKSNPHDFGTYLSVECTYPEESKLGLAYALACESHGPETWEDHERFDWESKYPIEEESEV